MLLDGADFAVVGYTADGIPTTRGDAVVARRPDGWGLAREAMSPGHSLRVIAPADGAEPWMHGPPAVVELRTPGDERWYPVDRHGEWAREGFADPWAALAAVKDRPLLRRGALAAAGRGTSRIVALRRMADDEGFVALSFGRRVVIWPVDGGQLGRRFWVDGAGADVLTAEQAAAVVDVLTGKTNAATEAQRAAWGLDLANRGEPATPTVRQREVLSRVGETFDLAELQESACHRYLGHTRRMAADMAARGAIEALGDGRFRKTERAVPSCVRAAAPAKGPVPAQRKKKPASEEPKKSSSKVGQPGGLAAIWAGLRGELREKVRAFVEPLPPMSQRFLRALVDAAPAGMKISEVVHALGLRATKELGGVTGAVMRWAPVRGLPVPFARSHADDEVVFTWTGWRAAAPASAPPKKAAKPTPKARKAAAKASKPAAVPFKAFSDIRDGRDNRKLWVAPDGDTVLFATRAWWVVRRTDGVWRFVAGPVGFREARRRAIEVAAVAAAPSPIGALQPTPAVELTPEARGVMFTVDALLDRFRAFAAKGDRVDLSPLAEAPFVARLSGLESGTVRQGREEWWSRTASWTIENDRRGVAAIDVARAAAAHHAAAFVPPSVERTDVFDLEWLKYRLQAVGCTRFSRMTDTFFAAFCAPAGGELGITLRQRPGGWVWSRQKDPDSPDFGPFTRASALLDDVVRRLGLDGQAPAPQASTQVAEPGFVLIGCVKTKGDKPAPAKDLYRGSLWDLRRRYAEARGLPWAILSGGLGVVEPDEEIDPYEKRLKDHTADQRAKWQRNVRLALRRMVERGSVIEVIAGRDYVEALRPVAELLALTIVAPLAGKGIGKRQGWLNLRIHELRGETLPQVKPAEGPKKASAKAIREQVKAWARSGDKPPYYTAPSKRVRFSQRGKRGYYRVEQRAGDGYLPLGPDHRTFRLAAEAALALDAELPSPLAEQATAGPARPATPLPLPPVDVGAPPADMPEARRLAWMIRHAADALGRPTRGVWVVCGSIVHPIGALPEGLDVKLPTVFVDMSPAGEVAAVDHDPGFLLAVEPVDQALRRYRMKLDEGQRAHLLEILRLVRGEGFHAKYQRDPSGIRRRFKEGFKRERVIGDREVWTDKSRTMSWVVPKGADNDQVIAAFFVEMARRLAAELPEAVRERAEQVLGRALRMARRQAPASMRPTMNRGKAAKAQAQASAPATKPQPARASFKDFTVSASALPGGSKAYTSPDERVVVFRASARRSGSGWYVLHRGEADRVWRVVAGPVKFNDARRAALGAQGPAAALAEPVALGPDTAAALGDPGKAAAAKVRALLTAVRGVDVGDEIDLTPLVGFAARVRWQKPAVWSLRGGEDGSADAIAKRLGRRVDANYVPPPERDEGFDVDWLRRELQRHGCDRLGAVTGGIYGSLCPRWGGKQFDLVVRQHEDGWYWSGLGDDGKGRGPWARARELFADVRNRLGLRPTSTPDKPAPAPSSAETIIGLPDFVALPKSKRPKYLVTVKDAAGLVVHLFQKAATRDQAHQAARGMLAVSPGMKLLVGKVDPKQAPAAFFEHVRALQKVDRLRLDLTEDLARGVKPIGATPSVPVVEAEVVRDALPKGLLGEALLGLDWETPDAVYLGFADRGVPPADAARAVATAYAHKHGASPADVERLVEELRLRNAGPVDAVVREVTPAALEAPEYSVVPSRHTKKGHPIWVVQKRTRVDELAFAALKRLAKTAANPESPVASGYYSSYSRGGAVPGFVFGSEPEARAFVQAATERARPTQAEPATAEAFAGATRVNRKAAAILELLTDGMHGPDRPERVIWRRIGEPGAAVMPLSIDWLGDGRFAVAHNYTENGDLIADPDVEFARLAEGAWIPLAIQQPRGYTRFVGSDGAITDRSGQRDLARFVGSTWMPNVEAMLLDSGTLPARRSERYASGGERELGLPDTAVIADLAAQVRGRAGGVTVFGYRPESGELHDISHDDLTTRGLRLGSLLARVIGFAGGRWWLFVRPGDRKRGPAGDERRNARKLVDAGAVMSLQIERVLLVADDATHDLLAKRDDAATETGPKRDEPATEARPKARSTRAKRDDTATGPAQPSADAIDSPGSPPPLQGRPASASTTDPKRDDPATVGWPEVPDQKGPRTIANLRAVRIAYEARRSGATPTAEQRRQMLQYSGWGGLSLDAIRDDWPDGIPLPDAEALIHEYYTPWQVCADITAAVRRLVGDDAEVLEPSAGTGRFVHTAEAPGWRWMAVELSPISALILEQSTEGADVAQSSFESWVQAHPERRFDAVISNPPYGKRGHHIVDDKDKRFRVAAAYHYFVLRGLSLLRPGGVGAFLIPGGFMDGTSTAELRARVDRDAELVAAFRLPSGLFPGARLSLDVVFLRNRQPGAAKAPDHVFQTGAYFDEHPAHVLGEIKPTGRYGEPEVVGEYPGLPHFEASDAALPAAEASGRVPLEGTFAEAALDTSIRFVDLESLGTAVVRAKNAGGKFDRAALPAMSPAIWRAAVDDIVQSRRAKKARLEFLRHTLEDLRDAAAKAERTRQALRDDPGHDAMHEAVLGIRDGRDAIKAGIAAIKTQPRRVGPKVTADQIGPFARRFLEPPLDALVGLHEWRTVRIPADDAMSDRALLQLIALRAIRVAAVDRDSVHIRFTDAGRAAVHVDELANGYQRSARARRAIEERGGTVQRRDRDRIEATAGGVRFTLFMPRRVNGQVIGYGVSWPGGNQLLDAPWKDAALAVEQALAAIGAPTTPVTAAEPNSEPELPPVTTIHRRPKAEAHARARKFAAPAHQFMEVWHIQGRALATNGQRLAQIPSDYDGPSQFVDRTGAVVPGSWGDYPAAVAQLLQQLHYTLDVALDTGLDGKTLRSVATRGSDDALLRVHAGQLYIEAADPQLSEQRHIGRATTPDMVAGVKLGQVKQALAGEPGSIRLKLVDKPQPLAHEGRSVLWSRGPLVIEREDGELHVISCTDLRGHEWSVNEVAHRPITTGPTVGAADAPRAHRLAPGFTALEMDSPAPARASKAKPSIPKALQAVDMDRATMDLADAIQRALPFTNPSDPIFRGVRVGDGLVVASDGVATIEIAVEPTGATQIVDPVAGEAIDYPELGALLPAVHAVATVDPAPLDRLDATLRTRDAGGAVELTIDGPHLLLDSKRVGAATIRPGSASGRWRFAVRRLRPALLGAKGGRILLGPATGVTTIERDDGQRIFLRCDADPTCEVCPPPAPVEPAAAPPPAPPRGPSESQLAELLARRLTAYEAADSRTKALLYPELAAALDAFDATFERRLATLDPPLFDRPRAESDAGARRILIEHPAGVPIERVTDPETLLASGWRVDGERLLPRDDYLSGSLWHRLARLEAAPDRFRTHVDRQRAELEDAIGEVTYPEIADRFGLRDGWIPEAVIGAYLGHLRGNKPAVALVRQDGLLQLRSGERAADYDALTERGTGDVVRLVLGYINHDDKVFRPKVSRTLKEDIHKKRRQLGQRFEQTFKAFLQNRADLRDLLAEAYRRTHRGFVPRAYPGDPLTLARWGDRITPHPHQNAGARRAVDQRGMVAAYGVGVGKTFTACATVALARQKLGTRRPVILVPNSLVAKWQRDIHAALPDFAVVTIGEKSWQGRGGKQMFGPDTKAERAVKWARFRAGLYDLALVTPSAFMRTRLEPDEFERLVAGATEIQRSVRLAQRNARGRSNPTERQQAVIEQGVRGFLAQMLESTHEPDDVRWSTLGVDLLIVDEAQNYKGLHSPETREGRIPRFMGNTQSSKRAWNLDARSREVRARDGFVVLLSATPAKNSPLELYNLWSYVNGGLWHDHGIHDPEQFVSRFLTIEPRLVVTADLEVEERPAVIAFRHLDELKSILLRWGEFIQPADIGLEVPEPTPEMVEVDMDDRQEAKYSGYVRQIEAALDQMRQGFQSNKVLGLLARMGLVSVHAELDRGLNFKSAGKGSIDPSSPKFEAIADYVLGNNTCGHIVFLQAIAGHRWLKDTLVRRGIAADRIGVLNAEVAQSSDARQRIADRFNEGRLDVVIANSIAYEGLDLQVRTCAIHHADLPWEPATLNQRNGRAVRQGNTLGAVAIRYYFARRSMDGLRFNLIQGKQGWMGALLEGSDAIANPGADLELGPDEILLLVSRTPEKTRAQLDKLRAKAEAKRREEEAERAIKLLEMGTSYLQEARDAGDAQKAADLRANAEQVLDELARVDATVWPWGELLAAARAAGADEILARPKSPPLFPGAWLRWEGDWYHVGRFGWRGTVRTVYLRQPGRARWSAEKVSQVAYDTKPEDIALQRPPEVRDDWPADAERVVRGNLGDPYSGWMAIGWAHADPAWLEAAWPRVADEAQEAIGRMNARAWGQNYGPKETRFPLDVDGAVYIHTRGGPLPAGAKLLPPTTAGWARWLELATGDDFKMTIRGEASRWWWDRPLRRGMQRTRQNPSRPGGPMRLPARTPIDSHLVIGIGADDAVVWLQPARGVREAQRMQKQVPADVPVVLIVRVDNNATRRGGKKCSPGPAFVPNREALRTGAGVLLVADSADELCQVRHVRDLERAYRARTDVGVAFPRVVIGEVRRRYSAKNPAT